MKSILSNIVFFLVIIEVNAQITIKNPYTLPATMQAPHAPTLTDMRQTEQQHIQQQNAAIMRVHNANTQSRHLHLQEFQAELRQQENQNRVINYEFPENTHHSAQYFKQSFAQLQNMLEGKQDISLKQAVFLSENAFFDNSLNYEWFCSDIDREMDILKQFMQKEKLDWNNETAKKYMLQKFFSDTLIMRDDKGNYQYTHYPYRYDFDDPFGKTDWRKMFVTKLLWSKTGQCHSMPLLYLIFAEELNIKAWLSFSPQHSYIKIQDDKGDWYNFETTNGFYSTNSWILSSGYVKTETLRNKIYMDTLSQKETVAACLIDLSNTYIRKFGFDEFVLTCVNKALQYSPKNLYALQLKSDYYTYLFQYVANQLGYPPKEQIPQYPQAYDLMQKALELQNLIAQTGYEDMPENIYQAWLQSFEKEKGKQPVKIIRP